MAIDKSARQHYAIQGGGPNYLGKQKMVKAPKKWKSSPDHEPAELAYITKKEKDILLDLNIYGSLKKGKPNRGPSGIISLQGDMGSVGGGGGGGGGNGGHPNRGWQTYAIGPAPTVGPADRHPELLPEPKTKAEINKEILKRTVTSFTPKTKTKVDDDDWGFQDKKSIAIQKSINPDVYAGVKTGDASIAETIAKEDAKISEREEERGYTDTGEKIEYFGDKPVTRKTAFNLGLLEKNIKTGEIQKGRNIINPFTQQLQSKFAPIGTPKKGLWGTLGNIALGILAPQLLGPKLGQLWSGYTQAKNLSKLASTFTGKDYVGDLTTNLRSNIKSDLFSGKTTPTDVKDDRFGQGDRQAQAIAPKKDVITESVEKFSPRQMDLVRQRYEQLQQVIQTGMFGNRRLTADELAKLGGISKQMEAFLVDPQKMMRAARGGIAGLRG